jgi:hypothetical protein
LRKETFIALILFSFSLISSGQNDSSYTITGTVVNGKKNTPLSGAHIITSNNTGSKTLENGTFTVTASFNDTIFISYIGFKTISYIAPKRKKGRYLTKFKLYKDSITLEEVEIFPYPTYKEFKESFVALNKQNEQIKIEGLNLYIDTKKITAKPSILNPASYIYDKLFNKQAKLKRRLDKYRSTIKEPKESDY